MVIAIIKGKKTEISAYCGVCDNIRVTSENGSLVWINEKRMDLEIPMEEKILIGGTICIKCGPGGKR